MLMSDELEQLKFMHKSRVTTVMVASYSCHEFIMKSVSASGIQTSSLNFVINTG